MTETGRICCLSVALYRMSKCNLLVMAASSAEIQSVCFTHAIDKDQS
jgi:hypothetical protein